MDATLRIKNLSIALEAVSRVVNCTTAFIKIENLLLKELEDFQEEKEKETQWPQRGPAKSTPHGDREYPDEDLPF